MPFATNEIIRVAYYFRQGDLRAAITRYYKCTSSTLGGPAEFAAAVAFHNKLTTPLLSALNQSATIQGITITHMSPPGEPPATALPLSDLPGTGSVDPAPPQLAGLVRLLPADGGRNCRGRVYVPFPGLQDIDTDSGLTATYIVSLESIGTALLQEVVASDTMPSPPFSTRTSRFRATLWHGPFQSNTLVAVTRTSLLWGTQRRRSTPPYAQFSPFG